MPVRKIYVRQSLNGHWQTYCSFILHFQWRNAIVSTVSEFIGFETKQVEPGRHQIGPLAFVLNITQLRFLYRQLQYSKPWVERCHIPVALRLDYSDVNDGWGFDSYQWWAIFHFIKFRLFHEQVCTVEMGAVALAQLAFRVLKVKKTEIYSKSDIL